MKRISIETVQKCQLSGMDYSKEWFISLLKDMGKDDFSRFCREVSHLNHHYDCTVGLSVTDIPDKIESDVIFTLNEVDFDSPITFKSK